MAKNKKTAYSGDDIQALGLYQGIRQNPGMYIGTNEAHGLHHILWELVDNANDEAMNGYATTLSVTIHNNGAISVTDDGRGFPISWRKDHKKSAMTLALTALHSGGKFSSNNSYSASGGLHGVGTKTTIAFSEYFIIVSRRHGVAFRQEFREGGEKVATPVEIYEKGSKKPIGIIDKKTKLVINSKDQLTYLQIKDEKTKVNSDKSIGTGTTVTFRPNREWFSPSMEWEEHSRSSDGCF